MPVVDCAEVRMWLTFAVVFVASTVVSVKVKMPSVVNQDGHPYIHHWS